ncbi:MAG: EamA family transporter [Sphingobacteriales bacterium]|nr:MAG: EamA family transporter [Sphingobacteriales bacterium]
MKKAFLQLHVAVFLAGFTAILGKLIGLGEGMLVWWRILLTVVVLAGWMFFTNKLKRVRGKDFLKIAGVGLIIALHWILFYGSIKYSTISVALVCFSATGFFTALLEPLILNKKISVVELFFGLLSIAGIYIIFDFHPQFKQGIVFGILAAVGSALFPIFNKKLLLRFEPTTLTLYELGGGLLLLTTLLPFYHQYFPASYYLPSTSDWLWLLILSVLCTVVMFILQLNALKKISAFTSNLSFNLEPLYGIIMAFLFFNEGEMLRKEFFIGLALIVLAVLLQMYMVWRASTKQNNIAVEPGIHSSEI